MIGTLAFTGKSSIARVSRLFNPNPRLAIAGPAWRCYAAHMIGPPPDNLTSDELDRLELVALPGPEGMEAECVYRFMDTGEFVTDNDEEEAMIKSAFPGARIKKSRLEETGRLVSQS